jgi:hypothetical protein
VKGHAPAVIGLNFWEELGGPNEYEPGMRDDGVSLTDYKLLAKEIGAELAGRIVSAEHMLFDYIAQPVTREIELCRLIRQDCAAMITAGFDAIVPGQTTVEQLGDVFRRAYRKDGEQLVPGDVVQRGDLVCLQAGLQSFYSDPYWPYGNVCEVTFEYAYVLELGETALPERYSSAWAHGTRVRNILDKNVLPGRTAMATLEVLERELTAAGYLFLKAQDYVFGDARVQVPLDMHAAGKGYYAPRLGYMGPDWQREMVLPENHHFYNEYWIYTHVPEWGDDKYLSIQFHDGAFATAQGTFYPAPHPTEIRLLGGAEQKK